MRYIKIILLLLVSNSLFGQGNTGNVLSGGVKSNAVFYTDAYGIRPDGSDQTTKIQALLDTVYNRGGGHIVFSPGTYRINGKLKPKVTYNGVNTPSAPDLVIEGAGAFNSGNYLTPTGGTILDCRYSGDTIGVFQFRGTGKTEFSRITFIKGATGLTGTPFIHTTFRTLHIHDCAFIGFSAVSRCAGIILGGDVAYEGVSPADTSFYNGFQGYGTVIQNNFFNFINTGIRFKTYANSVVVTNNNFWNGCGGLAAITITPAAANCYGNVVSNNLIEISAYTYGILLGRANGNSIIHNNFFDPVPGTSKANVRALQLTNNMVISGGVGGVIDDLYDPFQSIRYIPWVPGDTAIVPNYELHTVGNKVLMESVSERVFSGADEAYMTIKTTSPYGQQLKIDKAGVTSTLASFLDYSGNTKEWTFPVTSSGTGRLTSEGNMRIFSKTGGETYIGDAANQNHLFLSGTMYGGLTSTTTTFKSGQGDKIMWGDATNPLSGDGAGLTSTTINILRTLNAAGTDGRHQALEFYATGTTANQLPVGNTAARPTGTRGLIRNNLQTGKFEGVRVGTSYERFFMLEDTLGASNGQVLTYNSGAWSPATNTSESTTIGAFQSSGNSNGLTLSGTDIRLHAASVSTPGGVNVGLQTFGVGADTKVFNGTGSGQITVDGNTDNTPAGINFTQIGGTDLMGLFHINSSDADNARLRFALEQDGGLVDQIVVGTLNDDRGMYSRNGLYEDVTTVTTSPYTVLYGDRNIYLDGTTITVNLQAIGTSTAETKIGRVIYFFNDNATSVTITPNGSETINDASSLTLLTNTGVTLLAVTGTKWITRD